MDKKKSVKGSVVNDKVEQEEMSDEFEEIVGLALSINIVTGRDNIESNSWECNALAKFAVSIDGEYWSHSEFPVKSVDNDASNAISTVMLAISNHVNDKKIYEFLVNQLKESEEQEEEDSEE